MNDIYDGEKMLIVCGSRPLTLAEWFEYESKYVNRVHNYYGAAVEFWSNAPTLARWFEHCSPYRFFIGIN